MVKNTKSFSLELLSTKQIVATNIYYPEYRENVYEKKDAAVPLSHVFCFSHLVELTL